MIELLRDKNTKVREEVCTWIYTIWDYFIIQTDNRAESQRNFFENLLKIYLNRALEIPHASEEFFSLISQIIV